jgi:hypothetical protein
MSNDPEEAKRLMSMIIGAIPAIPASAEPVALIQHLLELEYNAEPVSQKDFPVKAFNSRLGQTLCEACDYGLDMGEMLFVPVGEDGYGYYHPECVLADQYLLDAFYKRVLK